MTEILIPILIISILIFLNGIFVAAEFAIVAVPHTRIAQLAQEGSSAATHIQNVLVDPVLQYRYITTAQVGITIVSLGLGMYGENVAEDWLINILHGPGNLTEPIAETIAFIISVGLLTYLHVVLGEMIPKTIALQSAEPTILSLARPMSIIEKIFLPAVLLFNSLGNAIVRLLGIPPVDVESRLLTPDELEFLVEESSEGGLLEPSDQLFIENILDLQERTVELVMTPRTRVRGIPINADEETVIRHICESRKSRYPIYNENLDQIIGIFHIKDLARFRSHPSNGKLDLRNLARPTIFVPESLSLAELLIRFQREHIQFAIVIDEFGGTAGIVTIEDLVEEVVGEIQDEFDREKMPIEELSDGVLRVRGDLILDELDQLYDLDLHNSESHNVAGLIMATLGRIPKPKDKIEYKRITIEVEIVERLAVRSVLLYLPKGEEK